MFSHRGYKIEVTTGGGFEADVDDIHIYSDTLKGAQEKIDAAINASTKKVSVALKVVGILSGQEYRSKVPAEVYPAVLTGLNRTSREPQFKEPLPKGREMDKHHILPDSKTNRELLAKFLMAEAAIEKLRVEVAKVSIELSAGYGRIEAESYPDIIKKLEADYARKAKL